MIQDAQFEIRLQFNTQVEVVRLRIFKCREKVTKMDLHIYLMDLLKINKILHSSGYNHIHIWHYDSVVYVKRSSWREKYDKNVKNSQ